MYDIAAARSCSWQLGAHTHTHHHLPLSTLTPPFHTHTNYIRHKAIRPSAPPYGYG